MKELIDFKSIWEKVVDRWKNSFGWFLVVGLAFVFGMTWQTKQITDDCKIIGSFRDATQAYSCQVRVR